MVEIIIAKSSNKDVKMLLSSYKFNFVQLKMIKILKSWLKFSIFLFCKKDCILVFVCMYVINRLTTSEIKINEIKSLMDHIL